MLSFVFGAFGVSTLWFIPLLWRLAAALIRRRRPPTVGPGAIRFWTGFMLVLLASATLEGLVVSHYTYDPSVGGVVCRALGAAAASFPGGALAALFGVAMLAVALPWYLGVPWSSFLARANAMLEPLGLKAARFANGGTPQQPGRETPHPAFAPGNTVPHPPTAGNGPDERGTPHAAAATSSSRTACMSKPSLLTRMRRVIQ